MSATDAALQPLLQELDVPADFNAYETTDDHQLVVKLEKWRQRAYVVLGDLQARLKTIEELSLQDRAGVVTAAAQFDGGGHWVTEPTRSLAQDVLQQYEYPDVHLVEHILSHDIRPIFIKNAHPKINLSTGRAMPRPAGGEMAHMDHYEGQEWKRHPGIIHVLDWCIRHLEGAAYERVWHLMIPPVMTLLDDYELRYKVSGAQVASHLLERVPPELLRRTGIDGLLFNSFKSCISFLRSPETPALLRSVFPASVTLIERTTSPTSEKRFEQLWALLGDGIIETIWFYGYEEIETLQATLDVLPVLVKALGVGSARYLKSLVTQLVHPLLPAPENAATARFQRSSLRALVVVMEECAPRISKWKDTILNGLCRRWVTLVESGADDIEARELKAALQDACRVLTRVCPSVTQNEFPRLLEMDEAIFRDLVSPLAEGR